jgi:broad specificity phosphatase PhoE
MTTTTSPMPTPERLRELASATEPRFQLVAPFFIFPGPDVCELLLIRHAQVPEGAMGEDAALTPLGYEQADVLAGYLATGRIDAVYAAPSGRTRATAAAIARRHGLEVEVLDGLRDVDNHLPPALDTVDALMAEFGEAEGRQRYEAMTNGGWDLDLFGGLLESSTSLRGRVAATVDQIVSNHPGQRVAAVSHAPTIASYACHVLGSPADFAFYPRLTSITLILARGERRQLHLLNATPHFQAL